MTRLEARFRQGVALHQQGRLAEAEIAYRDVLRQRPKHVEALHMLGVIALQAGKTEEGMTFVRAVISLNGRNASAHNNLGNGLWDLRRHEEAVQSFDKAIALKPDYADAWCNRANALRDLGRHAEANADYSRAIALKPDYAEAYWNQSLCLLQMGQYEQGWRQYEWRKRRDRAPLARSFQRPLWLGGGDIAGKTLLLHSEQGFGDTIQFCRYAKLAEARGARVIMDVQPSLRRLLGSLSPTIQVIDPSEKPGAFDYHCPMQSLPLAFGTTLETIPAETAYLRADEEARARWRARLPPKAKARIGIVWSGNSLYQNDPDRSIGLATLRPLIGGDADWFCLQKEIRTGDNDVLGQDGDIAVFNSQLNDFADTAALVEQMDLVLTVDTSVAHLAAALGKPVWLMLPFNPDWRWLLDRDDSPWYPTVRLFRQPRRGDWAGVIGQVANELQKRSATGQARF